MDTGNLFERMREEIPGFLAAAVGDTGGGMWRSAGAAGHDLEASREGIRAMALAWQKVYAELGGRVDFGAHDELLATATRGYLLVQLDHGSGRFVAVHLDSDGNIGYLRFRLRAWLKELSAGGLR